MGDLEMPKKDDRRSRYVVDGLHIPPIDLVVFQGPSVSEESGTET